MKLCFPHKEENPSFVRRISAHHRHDFGFSNQELKSVINVRRQWDEKQSMLFNVYVKNYIITHSCPITFWDQLENDASTMPYQHENRDNESPTQNITKWNQLEEGRH